MKRQIQLLHLIVYSPEDSPCSSYLKHRGFHVRLSVSQITRALQFAHERKIVHRDVKPENMLLLDAAGTVALSDFGIAIAAHHTQSLSPQHPYGTAVYMAPEHIQGKARPASDQYALGVVVYEWLTGVWPFIGKDALEIALSYLNHPPTPPRHHVPSISPAVERVVLKALAKDPHQRFECVQAFAEALQRASQCETVTRTTGTGTD